MSYESDCDFDCYSDSETLQVKKSEVELPVLPVDVKDLEENIDKYLRECFIEPHNDPFNEYDWDKVIEFFHMYVKEGLKPEKSHLFGLKMCYALIRAHRFSDTPEIVTDNTEIEYSYQIEKIAEILRGANVTVDELLNELREGGNPNNGEHYFCINARALEGNPDFEDEDIRYDWIEKNEDLFILSRTSLADVYAKNPDCLKIDENSSVEAVQYKTILNIIQELEY